MARHPTFNGSGCLRSSPAHRWSTSDGAYGLSDLVSLLELRLATSVPMSLVMLIPTLALDAVL
ncbi:hypothetical protein, partial [Oceanospirillum linum]|uniref:hypothetical protein n=1 Tax=Oceanospirillum linum TaxID=966 RepID=UPI0024BA0CBD